jgi:hypothetical protein
MQQPVRLCAPAAAQPHQFLSPFWFAERVFLEHSFAFSIFTFFRFSGFDWIWFGCIRLCSIQLPVVDPCFVNILPDSPTKFSHLHPIADHRRSLIEASSHSRHFSFSHSVL